MTRSDDARAKLEAALARMTEIGCWEWQLSSFDGDKLTLVGGQDMDHAHFVEADFHGVTYINCPSRLKHPRFRLATDYETMNAGSRAEVEPGSFVIAIDADTTSNFDVVSLLVARSITIREGRVSYTSPR